MKPRHISLLVIIILSIIYFQVKDNFKIDESVIQFPELKLSDSTNFLIERWHVNRGYIFSRDTFPNCRYNYRDSVVMITFDSSTVWRDLMQFEISKNKTGIFYDNKSNGSYFIQPHNGTAFLDTFAIAFEMQEVMNQEEQIMIDLHYRYNVYSIDFFKKQRWYHKYNPAFGTERTPHLIKGKCLCQKTDNKIESKSDDPDFVYYEEMKVEN